MEVGIGMRDWQIICDINKRKLQAAPESVYYIPKEEHNMFDYVFNYKTSGSTTNKDSKTNDANRIYVPENVKGKGYVLTNDRLYKILLRDIRWTQKPRNNRMVAVYGDVKGIGRIDSIEDNSSCPILPWCLFPSILDVKERIEKFYHANTGIKLNFTVCILNYYKDGNDSISWHSDHEELDRSTPIASVSLGASRQFLLRSTTQRDDRIWCTLENGSLMIMESLCQHRYVHCVPRDDKCKSGRINLTFRCADKEYLESREKSYF